MKKNKKGFTLAETLIALVILGIVAAITIPSLIQKYIEATNRTKVKKAMASYEKALNQMVIDNDIKGAISAAEGFRTADNCSGSSPYFKAIKYAKIANSENTNNCRFQTSDRVWWDITDIEHPIIALNEEDLDNTNAEKRFVLVGHLEDGILRINDSSFETTDPNKTYLTKLYNFINNTEGASGSGTGGGTTEKCTTTDNENYTCTGSELTWKKIALTEAQAAMTETNSDFCIWDGTDCKKYDDNTSRVLSDTLYTSEVTLTQDDIDNSCTGSQWSDCNKNDYWNAYRKKCAANGAHLATAAELKAMYNMTNSPLDSNSYYWAAEASSNSTIFAYNFFTYTGFVTSLVDSSHVKAVCVGN